MTTDPINQITTDWHAIRRANDALAEVVDNAVEELRRHFQIDETDDAHMETLFDHVYRLVTQGDPLPSPGRPVIGLECSDCGYIALTIEDAEIHESDNHGGWDTIRL